MPFCHACFAGIPVFKSIKAWRTLAPAASQTHHEIIPLLSPKSPAQITECRGCIAIVDPVSTGALLACEAAARGFAVIAVWSAEVSMELRSHLPLAAKDLCFDAEVQERGSIEKTAMALLSAAHGYNLLSCVVGAESGVQVADALSEYLGLRTNGTSIGDRRDKSLQQTLVRAAGLRATREACSDVWSDVEDFVKSEMMPVVVKPVDGAGSDGVKICHSVEEAKQHFHLLNGSQKAAGATCAPVLVQEFLKGKEYIVDHVSCNGFHKTMMVWVYDKRPCNGGDFVYFGKLPVPSDSLIATQLVTYVRGVLDTLGLRNGPTHGEVIMTDDGPCLVEMNCRLHGGDGAFVPLARALSGGYSQVDATVDSLVNDERFQQMPDACPFPFRANGQTVELVSMHQGRVSAMPGFDRIRQLESFVSLQSRIKVGRQVKLTIDARTRVGSVVLVHTDADVLAKDIAFIRQMERDGSLFEFQDLEFEFVMQVGGQELE